MKYFYIAGLTFVVSTISVAIYTRVSMLSLGILYDKSIVGVFQLCCFFLLHHGHLSVIHLSLVITINFFLKKWNVATHKVSKLNLLVVIISLPIILSTYAFGSMIYKCLIWWGFTMQVYTFNDFVIFDYDFITWCYFIEILLRGTSGFVFFSKKCSLYLVWLNIPFIYGMCCDFIGQSCFLLLFSIIWFRHGFVLKCICKHSFQELVIDNFDLWYWQNKRIYWFR